MAGPKLTPPFSFLWREKRKRAVHGPKEKSVFQVPSLKNALASLIREVQIDLPLRLTPLPLLRWAERETPDESHEAQTARLLSLIDVLVDGEFVEEKKNLRLAFRGSENQRLIDVKESLRQGRTVCL